MPYDKTIQPPPPTMIVIFGASGDLAHQRLIPALVNLEQDEYLPSPFYVIGASRTPFAHEQYRADLRSAVKKYSRREISDTAWEKFAKNTFYLSLDATKTESFEKLKSFIGDIQEKHEQTLNLLYYLSTDPKFFGPITENLKAFGLIEPYISNSMGSGSLNPEARTTRIIVEKPFGHDLETANELNVILRKNLSESQIFRIDHYLGKEAVQNILVFRFANGIFEPLWNSKYIDNIQITVNEDIGVANRGEYFDKSGITRDMVQNHLLQMLALTCIEPPVALRDSKSIRDEKVKVLRSIREINPNRVHSVSRRGQYVRGIVKGETVNGYREEKGIRGDSMTETAVALKLYIDNWRWSGVPIFLRVGKRLPQRTTEICIQFKKAPSLLFAGKNSTPIEPNVLLIRVQPKEGISLTLNSKPPGPKFQIKNVEMDFSYMGSFDTPSPEAYERLLLDAMRGDATLFIRDDEIQHSWQLLEPLFEGWRDSDQSKLDFYPAGTWGPDSFKDLISKDGRNWIIGGE